MTGYMWWVVALAATTLAGHTSARSEPCKVLARTDAGWVCGHLRDADDGSKYASFRGVPYGKPPVGERRFKELEPPEPWDNLYDATNEGPICLQTDVIYRNIMKPRSMSENCIFANIHVPANSLPKAEWRPARELVPPIEIAAEAESRSKQASPVGLPIFVFIHGGGFAFGSGDSDLHGPEYLVSNNVIVVTFNYRTNIFGFLPVYTPEAPGNAGLRDMVTLLRWVQRNARAFGGDPDNVTIAGQSAGAAAAHLLTLSNAAEGLFNRAILMSGTAISSFFSPSMAYAQLTRNIMLDYLRINATDPQQILQQLIDLPAEKLVEVNRVIIDQMGLTTFVPTVETRFPGVTPILDDYPEALLQKGRGKNIPLIIGYTNVECETFRARLKEFDFVDKAKANPLLIIPPKILFSTPPSLVAKVAKNFDIRYYNGSITVDGFVKACTDGFFEYPVLTFVEEYEKTRTAPTYVYKFSYQGDANVFETLAVEKYSGTAHIEDLTYVFKTNTAPAILGTQARTRRDDNMTNFMIKFIVNFMTCGKPICDVSDPIWPEATSDQFRYEEIYKPFMYQVKDISTQQEDLKNFYKTLTTAE